MYKSIIAVLFLISLQATAAPFARTVVDVSDTEYETLTITQRSCDLSAKYTEQVVTYYEQGLNQEDRTNKLLETAVGQLADDEVWVALTLAMKLNSQVVYLSGINAIQQFIKKGQTYPKAFRSMVTEGCPSSVGQPTKTMRRIYAK